MAASGVAKRKGYGAADIARILEVSLSTVYSWCRTAGLPHERIRGRICFSLSEVEAWERKGGRPNMGRPAQPGARRTRRGRVAA